MAPCKNRDTSTQHDAELPNTPVCLDLASTLATIHGARHRPQALLAVRSTPCAAALFCTPGHPHGIRVAYVARASPLRAFPGGRQCGVAHQTPLATGTRQRGIRHGTRLRR